MQIFTSHDPHQPNAAITARKTPSFHTTSPDLPSKVDSSSPVCNQDDDNSYEIRYSPTFPKKRLIEDDIDKRNRPTSDHISESNIEESSTSSPTAASFGMLKQSPPPPNTSTSTCHRPAMLRCRDDQKTL